jgi:monoamine oxidase
MPKGSKPQTECLEADFAIIGAGYAGLTAALRLTQTVGPEGRHYSVVVLEARERVGGRVWTQTLDDGTWLDFGGTWFGPGQDYSYGLAAEMQVPTYPTYDRGDSLTVLPDGTIVRRVEDVPLAAIEPGTAVALAMLELEAMAAELPADAPWRAAKAREWDRQTLAGWTAEHLADESGAIAAVDTIFTGIFCCDTSEVSLLDALYMVRSHQGFARLMSVKGGNQQDRIVGGAQAIAEKIAAQLGDRIRKNTPVREIRQDADGVDVIADHVQVRAKRVIVTVPPALAGHLTFDPPLPAERALLLQRLPGGSVIKALALYDEPFWRQDGLNGQSFAVTHPVGATYDGCTDGHVNQSGKGLLIVFVFGAHAAAYGRLSDDERRRKILEALVHRFGPRAAAPKLYVEHQWAEQIWSRGGVFAHFPPGVWTNYGPILHEPCGRIHWAGTETSTAFHGSINGAIESGERAAREAASAG